MLPMPVAEPAGDDQKRQSDAAAAQAARHEIAHALNGLFRRLRQYETEAGWVSLVMEGAAAYARQAALFVVQGEALELRAAVNLDLPPNLRLAARQAAAFDAVVSSKESVTALRTVSEVGAELSSLGQLAYLFPILNGSRVAAVLFAAADAEVDPLELVCGMAASALERQANAGRHSQIALAPSAKAPPAERRLVPWAEAPVAQHAVHSRAARFARVTVAEMQLNRPAACRLAREKGDIYSLLAREIDKAREIYRKQFMTISSMVDYFHRELVAVLLAGDATKLGADYPGELA